MNGMITEELLDFIRTQHAAHMSVPQMKHLLVTEGGWDDADVNEALRTLNVQQPTPHTPDVDDFLGIFSTREDTAHHAEHHNDKIASTAPISAAPEGVALHQTQPQSGAPSRRIFSPQPSSPPPKATFDLSVLRKNIALGSSPTTLEKKHSISQPSQIGTTPTNKPEHHGSEIAGSESDKTEGSKVWKSKTHLLAMRTMSSDLFSHGKGDVVLDTPPALSPDNHNEAIGAPKQEQTTTSLPSTLPQMPLPHDSGVAKAQFDAIPPSYLSVPPSAPSTIPSDGGVGSKVTKTVKTKSIAEMWLQDAEGTVQGLTEIEVNQVSPTEGAQNTSKRDALGGMLLRGKGKVIPGIPALALPPEIHKEAVNVAKQEQAPLPLHESGVAKEQFDATGGMSSSPSHRMEPRFIKEFAEKTISKNILPFIGGAFVFIVLVIGLLYAALQLRGQDFSALLANASQQFYDLTSFGYEGGGSTDFLLSTATDGPPQKGKIKFSLEYKGVLQNGSDGYGDGMHHIKFTGGIESGDFAWETDIDADVFVIGQTLYFHVLSFPSGAGVDPELFKTYWAEVDLSEIAKELALDGLKTGLEEYGGFAREYTTFNEVLEKNFPFTVEKKLADEMQGGVMSYRFRLKSDPERMAAFIRAIYHSYTNKELALNVNQELRFKDALEKITGDVWINVETGSLVKFAFSGDLDDDIAGVHVKGPLALSFAFTDFDKKFTVDKPSPILSLSELRVRMDDYKVVMEKRERDVPRIALLHSIEKALADYYEVKGRYPTLLAELVSAKVLDSTAVSSAALKTLFYAPYASGSMVVKSTRCTTGAKVCAFYHLGVNLEDTENPVLFNDADKQSDVRGKDSSGCGTEKEFACFDVITPTNSTSTAPSGQPVSN